MAGSARKFLTSVNGSIAPDFACRLRDGQNGGSNSEKESECRLSVSLEENKKVVGNSPSSLLFLPRKSDSACSGGSNLNFSARTRAHRRGVGRATPLLALALDPRDLAGAGRFPRSAFACLVTAWPRRRGCSGRCGSQCINCLLAQSPTPNAQAHPV